jgi:hypothetical protein
MTQALTSTRLAGLYVWNQLGRKVKKGEKGIRILASIIGIKRKKEEEAEKGVTRQNTRVLEAETFLFARAALPGDALYKGLLPQTWPLRRSSLRGPLRHFCRLL